MYACLCCYVALPYKGGAWFQRVSYLARWTKYAAGADAVPTQCHDILKEPPRCSRQRPGIESGGGHNCTTGAGSQAKAASRCHGPKPEVQHR